MDFSDSIYLHALNMLPILGPRRLVRLHDLFGSYKQACKASPGDLQRAGLNETQTNQIALHLKTLSLEHETEKLDANQITLVSLQDDAYPALLAEIPDPPALLYVRGKLPPADSVMVSTVGTRSITTYGRTITPDIVLPLARSGMVIVSGLAFGVDALAHQTCIDAKTPTIAVLGSGIDVASVYPRSHSLLAEQIIDGGGALISEYPPGTQSFKQHFVARNRIISGISVGTIIIEANLKSGALITARHALDQNRSVYAVPGPVYAKTSEGPNNLIKLGAKLITSASDILDDLQVAPNVATMNEQLPELTPHEKIIFDLLTFEPTFADTLVENAQLDAQTVATTLTYLEIKGLVRNLGAGQYVKARL